MSHSGASGLKLVIITVLSNVKTSKLSGESTEALLRILKCMPANARLECMSLVVQAWRREVSISRHGEFCGASVNGTTELIWLETCML